MDLSEPEKWLLDERLLHSQKMAAIGELAAGIAHEINNPLAVIRQETEWLLRLLTRKESLDPQDILELRESLHQVLQQVDRCSEITRNLLDFARKREPVFQAVDLHQVIETMTMLVEKEAKKNHINILRQYDPDLPLVDSDAPQLRQVILNLLNNAVQAIEKDGTIIIITSRGDDSINIAVQDTGRGIPAEHLEKVFDPFFTTKPLGKGTGLGLSICHGIIHRLGGKIAVASTVGQGTTVTVTLPLKP
jgi:two-component system NtrC family sensor kinase